VPIFSGRRYRSDRRALIEALAARATACRRIAVDGPDAAGKTTLADELAHALRSRGFEVTRMSGDSFLRPAAERHRQGRHSPEGYFDDSFDYESLRAGLAEAETLVVCDGVFLLQRAIADLWDLRIFVTVSFEEMLRRALDRDVARLAGSREEVERLYRERYIPGQRLYLEREHPLERTDLVVDNEDPERPLLKAAGLA
jgi:uridine kinase